MNFNMASTKRCILFLSLTLLLCVCTINSALLRIPNSEDKDHPNLCHYKHENGSTILLLKPEEYKKHPFHCSEVHCDSNFEIVISTCPAVGFDENCKIVIEDEFNDPYPKCCGEVVCN